MNRPENRLNRQNDHVINSTKVALAAAYDLARRGFTLLSVEVGNRNPRMTVRAERRCQCLKGAVRMITGDGHGGRTTTMTANHLGAQVEWEELA